MPSKPENLEWIDISDFSPGITATPGSSITPAAPGAAADAFMCLPGPTGGLIPAPRLTRTYEMPSIANLTVGRRDPSFPYGCVLDFLPWGVPSSDISYLLEGSDSNAFPIEDEFHLLTQHYDLNGGNQRRIIGIRAHRLEEITGSSTVAVSDAGSGSPYQETYSTPDSGAMTFNASNRYYGPGNLAPCYIFASTGRPALGFLAAARTGTPLPLKTDSAGQSHQLWSWGSDSLTEPGWAWITQTAYAVSYSWTPSGTTQNDIALTRRSCPLFAFGHQGRGCVITYGNAGEPSISSGGTVGNDDTVTNALVATSLRFSTAGNAHLANEWTGWLDITEPIGGVAAVQTLSSDDLLVLGNTGGAVRIRGDLGTSPQVTRLPMLPSGLGRATHITHTPEGLVWGTRNGAWLWTGGDTAQSLSPQLPYDFWWDDVMDLWAYNQLKGRPVCSYPYLFFPNGWVCDLRFKSWFRFGELDALGDYPVHYGMSANGDVLACHPKLDLDGTTTDLIRRYDPSEYHDNWNWTSQPFAVTRNRVMSYREISLTVLNPTSTNTLILSLFGRDETNTTRTWTKSVTVDPQDYPQVLRFEMSLEVAEAALFLSTDSSGGTALSVHRVAIGYSADRSVARR